MIGRFIRFLFVMAILLGALAYFTGYWQPEWLPTSPTAASTRPGDTETAKARAREAGRAIGDTAKQAAHQLDEAFSDGSLTAKIKSKMALDDTIEASRIDIDTAEGVVRLNGTVDSEAQRTRALQLARETDGVVSVVDELKIR